MAFDYQQYRKFIAAKGTAGIAAISLALASPAMAASNCAPRDLVASGLADRHQEHVVGRGTRAFVHGVGVVEIWASESGSWTETVTYDNGATCVTASGQNWNVIAAPTAQPPGVVK